MFLVKNVDKGYFRCIVLYLLLVHYRIIVLGLNVGFPKKGKGYTLGSEGGNFGKKEQSFRCSSVGFSM